MSFRAGLFLGSAAAFLAALPASLRAAHAGAVLPLALLVLAGGTALVVGPFVALARGQRPSGTVLPALFAGAAVGAVPLAVLGSLLVRQTHHRPLGAATFAALAAIAVVVATFVAWRALVWLKGSEPGVRERWSVRLVNGAALLAFVVLLAGVATSTARSMVVDGALVAGLSLLAWLVRVPPALSVRLGRWGLPVWAVLVAVALVLSRGSVGAVVGEVAPVLSPLNGW